MVHLLAYYIRQVIAFGRYIHMNYTYSSRVYVKPFRLGFDFEFNVFIIIMVEHIKIH